MIIKFANCKTGRITSERKHFVSRFVKEEYINTTWPIAKAQSNSNRLGCHIKSVKIIIRDRIVRFKSLRFIKSYVIPSQIIYNDFIDVSEEAEHETLLFNCAMVNECYQNDLHLTC